MLKVELGLDLGNDSPIGFKLDDAVRGKLDSPYVLGGDLFYDVTADVKSVATRRGKNQSLGNYDSGSASIVLHNNERQYDPTNPDAALAGGLVPRREVRITRDTKPVYFGYIDDINLSYRITGESEVEISCVDGFSVLANAVILTDETTILEKSSARVTKVLALPDVAWDVDYQNIETGSVDVLAQTIPAGTNALEYLRLVTNSENGALFFSNSGVLNFDKANSSPLNPDFAFTDDISITNTYKVGFDNIEVNYGSELLYNKVIVSNGTDTVTVDDTISQTLYGIRPYELTNLLTSGTTALTTIANAILSLYKEPRYRFESLKVRLNSLSEFNALGLLDLELGDLVTVIYTPNGIPPQIEQSCRIVGIAGAFEIDSEDVIFTLEPFASGPTVFILDSPTSGVLDDDLLG